MNERWEILIVGLLMFILISLSLLCGYKIRGAIDKAQACADSMVIIHTNHTNHTGTK